MQASEAEIIAQVYRGLLLRDPDAEGLERYASELSSGQALSYVLESFTGSQEFLARFPGDSKFALDGASAMDVQTICSAAEAAALWNHIASVWSGLGNTDPYWSVLTDEKWRMPNMGDGDRLNAFYNSGESEVWRLNAWLERNRMPKRGGVCAELGCGVGRITRALARQFDRVIAFDISQPHLDAAKARLDAEGLRNVEYRLLRRAGDLDALPKVDCFYSIIVLQHNPPPIIVDMLSRIFARIRAGGSLSSRCQPIARSTVFRWTATSSKLHLIRRWKCISCRNGRFSRWRAPETCFRLRYGPIGAWGTPISGFPLHFCWKGPGKRLNSIEELAIELKVTDICATSCHRGGRLRGA